MNLAQFIDPEHVERMKARGDVRPGSMIAQPATASIKIPSRRERILAALGGTISMDFDQLFHASGGGNRNSFGVTLSNMRSAGEVLADGEAHGYRYRLPA